MERLRLMCFGEPLPDELAAMIPDEMKAVGYQQPEWLTQLLVHVYQVGLREGSNQ